MRKVDLTYIEWWPLLFCCLPVILNDLALCVIVVIPCVLLEITVEHKLAQFYRRLRLIYCENIWNENLERLFTNKLYEKYFENEQIHSCGSLWNGQLITFGGRLSNCEKNSHFLHTRNSWDRDYLNKKIEWALHCVQIL